VETHGHWDHVQAVPQLRDAGYEVAVRAEDAAMLPSYDLLLEDDDLLEVGRLRLTDDAHPRSHARIHVLPDRRVAGSPLR